MSKKTFLNGHKCYYVLSRSRQERAVFSGLTDYREYFRLLKRSKRKFKVRILAFCVMPDYVGLILYAAAPQNIPVFLNYLNDRYRDYFNKKYGHNGAELWCRPSQLTISADKDLVTSICHLEAAPVRCGLADSPVQYPWSSCTYRVLGVRNQILDAQLFNPSPKNKHLFLKFQSRRGT